MKILIFINPAKFCNNNNNQGGKPEIYVGLITGKGGIYYSYIIACILVLCNHYAMLFANVFVYFIPNK